MTMRPKIQAAALLCAGAMNVLVCAGCADAPATATGKDAATRQTVTGSHLPLAWQGRGEPTATPARVTVYDAETIRATGANTVGAALRTLDPNITP
jgi:hypothetical protein